VILNTNVTTVRGERMSQQLMDFEEVKRYLKLTKSTFYRLLQNNQIPASKIGRQWRFKKEEIDKWLEESKNINTRRRPDRRKYPRIKKSFDLEVRCKSSRNFPARSIDISQGGLSLKTSEPILICPDTILSIRMSDEKLPETKAKMVWARSQFKEKKHSYGIEFVKSLPFVPPLK
jgi:excisionase family DNA binding protein